MDTAAMPHTVRRTAAEIIPPPHRVIRDLAVPLVGYPSYRPGTRGYPWATCDKDDHPELPSLYLPELALPSKGGVSDSLHHCHR